MKYCSLAGEKSRNNMIACRPPKKGPIQRVTACTPLKALRVGELLSVDPRLICTPPCGVQSVLVPGKPHFTPLSRSPKPRECSLQGHRQGPGLRSDPHYSSLPCNLASKTPGLPMNLELWRMGWFGSRQVHPSPHRSFSGTRCQSLHQSGTENQSGPGLELGCDSSVGNKMARDTMGKAGRKHHKT